ncbi:MAG: multiheme c-type cytochrome [Bryobacteraceae bacterium]
MRLVWGLLAVSFAANAAPASFVGSARCRTCHAGEFERWSHDWHARALSPARAEVVAGRFDGQHYKGTSSEAWMSRAGPAYQMRTLGAAGTVADFAISWLIGGKRMQDTVTVMPDGAWQVLPVYFHVTGGGAWVDYTEAKQGTLDAGHPFFWTNFRRNANHECLDCHTTGLVTAYDRGTKKWRTEFADAGVACESCHGPGAAHAASAKAADIVNPAKLSGELGLAVCGSCHGPREPVFPILDGAHRYRPGRRYDDYYEPMVVVDGGERSGDYFVDGRPKSSSFEFQALVQSQCYLKGKATCLSCHNAPHEESAGAELKPLAAGDASCKKCHAAIAASGSVHTRHTAKAAPGCLACHMPKTVTGVLDQFADHAIDVPVPANTVRHGIPNACGTCHPTRTAAVLQSDVMRLWPGAGKRQARRLRLADAIDEKTARNSQTALTAVVADEGEAVELRGAAALLLAQRFGPAAKGPLEALLGSRPALLRTRALEGLAYARSTDSADAVFALATDHALVVRETAALVLSALGDIRAEGLLRKLADDGASSGLPKPHQALGIAALQRGQVDVGIVELEKAVTAAPYWADALTPLGAGYYRKGQLDKARQMALQALHFVPDHPGAQRLLQRLDGK